MNPTCRQYVRQLIWAYFWLLLGEGILRKWLLPQLSTFIFLARDPVVIAAYLMAWRGNIFPKNIFVITLLILGPLSFLTGLIAEESNILVAMVGARTNYLHLPMIFLMPLVMDLEDAKKFGRWMLILSVPIAALMVLQFQSSPASWINNSAMAGIAQIDSVEGRIRPAGPFVYSTGPTMFYGMVCSYLFYSILRPGTYKASLTLPAMASLLVAMSVSGSRSLIATVATVAFSGIVMLAAHPRLFSRFVLLSCCAGVLFAAFSTMGFFGEGQRSLMLRFEAASDAEGGLAGTASRFGLAFTEFLDFIPSTPWFGYGLGMGTNGGAFLLTGEMQFLLAEAEWSRIILELGPIMGVAFIAWRVAVTAMIGFKAVVQAFYGYCLPVLVFGAIGQFLLIQPFGPATSLGFAVFGSGLVMVAMRQPHAYASETMSEPVGEPEGEPHLATTPDENRIAA
jgi:hypothetical protein